VEAVVETVEKLGLREGARITFGQIVKNSHSTIRPIKLSHITAEKCSGTRFHRRLAEYWQATSFPVKARLEEMATDNPVMQNLNKLCGLPDEVTAQVALVALFNIKFK